MSRKVLVLVALVMLMMPAVFATAQVQAESPEEAVPVGGQSSAFFPGSECGVSSSSPKLDLDAEPEWMSGCTAEVTCWGGDVVSCSGTTTCYADCGSVLCDGTTWVECTCDVPLPCAGYETAYCNCRSCGGTHQQCYSCWCLQGGNC